MLQSVVVAIGDECTNNVTVRYLEKHVKKTYRAHLGRIQAIGQYRQNLWEFSGSPDVFQVIPFSRSSKREKECVAIFDARSVLLRCGYD